MNEQIFVTGATGCIGHYICEELKSSFPNATLHLLVRNPDRFKQDILLGIMLSFIKAQWMMFLNTKMFYSNAIT